MLLEGRSVDRTYFLCVQSVSSVTKRVGASFIQRLGMDLYSIRLDFGRKKPLYGGGPADPLAPPLPTYLQRSSRNPRDM